MDRMNPWTRAYSNVHGSRESESRSTFKRPWTAGIPSASASFFAPSALPYARNRIVRVAFLKPPIEGILGLEMLTFVEPLGLICVAGALEELRHECAIFDLRIDGEEAGMEACRRFAPDVVGLQCNFTTERKRTLRLAQRVRREMPGTFIVVGGHDASREPHWFAQEVFDVIAVGDGEEVMPPLVEALAHERDLRGVPGLVLNPVVHQGSD